jgi:SPP1 gp7 family putative phage head morphogenesis protein
VQSAVSHITATLDAMIVKASTKLPIDKLAEKLQATLEKTWSMQARDALAEALLMIERLSEGGITPDELKLIDSAIGQALGMSMSEAVRKPVATLIEAAQLMGAKEAVASVGASFAWGLPDIKALATLKSDAMFWIGDYYADNLQQDVRVVLNDFFTGGYDRRELIYQLEQKLGPLFNKSKEYWDLFADHTASKVREIGRVSGYEQAGIKKAQFRAWLDQKTSKICRAMHGRIIEVKDMRAQVDGYLDACGTKDKEKIKAAWLWVGDKQADKYAGMKTKDIVKEGCSLPPLHARCRSITVAWFESDGGARMQWGKSPEDKDFVSKLTADEHLNFIKDVQRNNAKLQWDSKKYEDDITKSCIEKHSKKDFGKLTRDEYERKAKGIVRDADRFFVHKREGEIQYCFASDKYRGYTVVNRDGLIMGAFGGPKKGGWEQCLENNLIRTKTEIAF